MNIFTNHNFVIHIAKWSNYKNKEMKHKYIYFHGSFNDAILETNRLLIECKLDVCSLFLGDDLKYMFNNEAIIRLSRNTENNVEIW